ncbi:MAG: HNH endonuclease [Propionibacterium sp.]|nr:HNH endonuclease [Propionibacterium sp.]
MASGGGRAWRWWALAVVIVLLVAMAATLAIWRPWESAREDAAGERSVTLQTLDGLEEVSGYSEARYDRDLFGQRWLDVDRNGCDTRNDILGRDLAEPVFKENTNDCKVLSGTLTDPYSGEVVDFISGQNTSVLVQIDHVVPLAWAWRHGAENWTMDRRAEFANDPRNLLASSQEMNQSKGASGPSAWLPPVRDLQCGYAEDWIEILDVYDLGVNAADRATLEGVLLGC